MAFSGNCPNCGAPVEFTAARSIVLVCESCESVVGRSGDALENYGKVADLVQTSSPLQVGATGAWRGRPFEIVGRVQITELSGSESVVHFIHGGSQQWISQSAGIHAFEVGEEARFFIDTGRCVYFEKSGRRVAG